MEQRLRMMYSSNAMWASSGYGVQGKSLLPRLAELPVLGGRQNISMFAWWGLQGGVHNVDGFMVYPRHEDPYGNDAIGGHAHDFAANLVISLIDVWVMHDTAQKVHPALWVPWIPIDHEDVPHQVLHSLQGCHIPLTYSRWGSNLLSEEGMRNYYIPHGVEPSIYRVAPRSLSDRLNSFKQRLVDGCDFLAVMVAANKGYPDRKGFQFQLEAWAEFAKDKPRAKLYIHTDPTATQHGLDIASMLHRLNLDRQVYFPQKYDLLNGYPDMFLSHVYNAADVFLGASMSEGFGIPIIEAQACGTPVIVTDFSSMPELVRQGVAVTPIARLWTHQGSYWRIPDPVEIRVALEDRYQYVMDVDDDALCEEREKLSKTIHDEFDWDMIVEQYWKPILEEFNAVAPDAAVCHRSNHEMGTSPFATFVNDWQSLEMEARRTVHTQEMDEFDADSTIAKGAVNETNNEVPSKEVANAG